MTHNDDTLRSAADLERLALRLGFLPFFRCGVAGFSVEEHTPREYWFTDEEGAWEWKGPVIREGHCAYGKFFNRKAGFVSRAWLADWANYRRSRPLASDEDTAALEAALADARVAAAVAGMEIVKKIVVKNKIVNLVVRPQAK